MMGTIFINLEGASHESTERCREMIHLMFEKGIFNIRNGSAELHFDKDGTLQSIKLHSEAYRRNTSQELLPKKYEYAIIKSLDPATAADFNQRINQTT